MSWLLDMLVLGIAAVCIVLAWWMSVKWRRSAKLYEDARNKSLELIAFYAQFVEKNDEEYNRLLEENHQIRQINRGNAAVVDRAVELREQCEKILADYVALKKENATLRRRLFPTIFVN